MADRAKRNKSLGKVLIMVSILLAVEEEKENGKEGTQT